MLTSKTKGTSPLDAHIGQRIRMRRLAISMSQEALSKELGITFQQVQKYEKGVNRVSSSRLQAIADVIKVPVSWFFESAPGESGGSEPQAPEALPQDALSLLAAFQSITAPKQRRAILALVRGIAAESEPS